MKGRVMKMCGLTMMCLLLTMTVAGQTVQLAAEPNIPRLLEARLPLYPAVAEAAHITGKVVVEVTVAGGKVANTTVKSGNHYLAFPTVETLKTWRFDATVNRTFTVTYTYEIAGEPTDDPTNPKVEILPSLDVKVTARPVKPTCSDCGAPPMKLLPHSAGANHESDHVDPQKPQ